ncbi:MAG: Stp1/IreP family PP2C-type Ser/Thr phosphatase [bacterium]|nr:Stp1/IreP family PP2C-type Ser/Thr phosphatase [bacterium]
MGRSRSTNEDYFAIRPESGLFLIADGMGGHGNGEVASRLVTLSVCESIEAVPRKAWGRKGSLEPFGDELRKALVRANQAVFKAVEENEDLAGMGATMVAMMSRDATAVIAHVGDSRAYRLRGGRLEQLTEDHTWVGQQVSAGELSLDEARSHPFRNVVTRALGGEAELVVDQSAHDVQAGDLFLLCTDGLTGVLEDEEIAEILGGGGTLDGRCATLIGAANDGGGPDNVTVLLVSFTESDSGS